MTSGHADPAAVPPAGERSRPGRPIVVLADVDLSRPDGTRSHVTEIVRGFVGAGRSVELVARGHDPQIAGARFHRTDGKRSGRVRRILGMNRVAIRVVLAMRPRTTILYYRFDAGIVGVVLLARIIGYRPVGEVNNLMFGTDYPDRAGGAREALLDRARVMTLKVARRVTRDFVAVTDRIKEIMVSGYGIPADRVHVLPNGVDTELFRPLDRSAAKKRLGLDASCRYVVFVGLMASWVDFRTMLHGFAGAAKTRPDARFVLVGDGPEARLVDSLVDDLDLAERAIRPGFIADRDLVSAYMGAASVCLVAYHGAMLQRIGGGSPMKLMEYFAAGRAVVATATEGMASMINSSGGGLAVGDAAAMAKALGALLDDQERADELGRLGRRAAVEHYSWKPVIERTLALLDRPS